MFYMDKINTIRCDFFLKKNGKLKYLPIYDYSKYLFIIKKIMIETYIKFPDLNGKNEDEIIKKLRILNYCKNFNLKYVKINNNNIFIFNDDVKGIKDVVINILFLGYLADVNLKAKKYFYETLDKTLITTFMLHKCALNKISDKNILIIIFYQKFIYLDEFKEDLMKNHNVTLANFSNYEELYKFLKKNGYVNKFYNVYAPKMINNYKKFYNKLKSYKELLDYKIEKENEIKNFKDIDLLKLVDYYVNNKFNKEYIKNKFII